ncbi:hypothetical protein Tco_0837375 [Tanacetum coccineum]
MDKVMCCGYEKEIILYGILEIYDLNREKNELLRDFTKSRRNHEMIIVVGEIVVVDEVLELLLTIYELKGLTENEEEVKDDDEEEDEFVKTPSNYTPTDDEDETNVESKIDYNADGDKEKGMDDTTNMLYDDVDETTLDQVVEDAHVTISTIAKKTEVPDTWPKCDLLAHKITFTPPPTLSTPTPPPTTKATNPPSTLLDFASVFQFNNRVSALEKEVSKLKKDDLLKTQVTALVDKHLESRIGATRDEFMKYLLAFITARIIEQVKILPEEVSNFAPCKSYLAAPGHKECYDGLVKSYELDKTLFSTYDKVYSSKRSQKDKDKDEDPSAGSDQGMKKRKTTKDAEPTKGPKTKESKSVSSKGTKSQPTFFGKSVQTEEPEFDIADTDMPQDQEGNMVNDDEEPKRKVASKSNADKPSKTFDDLMSTPIDFSAFIMDGLKINNLTQETLLGPAFKLLKGTRTNYADLEYDFEDCYKAL